MTTSQEDEQEPVQNSCRGEESDQQQDRSATAACDDGVSAVQNTHRENHQQREDVDGGGARDDSAGESHSLAVRTDDEKMRAKTRRRLLEQRDRADPGLSLSSGAAVDGHRDGHRVVSAEEEDVPQPKLTAVSSVLSGGGASSGVPRRSESESLVNHSEPRPVEQIMSIVDGDTVTTNAAAAAALVVNTSDSRRLAPVESPPPSPPPPPVAKAIPLPPRSSSEVTNRGHPKIEPLPPPPPLPGRPGATPLPLLPLTVEALSTTASGNGDGQIPGGDHSSQADPADADPSGAQDSVDAVVPIETVPSADQSVLLKYIHGTEEDTAVRPAAERKRSSSKKKSSSSLTQPDDSGASGSGKRSKPAVVPRSGPGNDDVDRGPKIEHINGGAAGAVAATAAGSGQYQRVNGGGYEATAPPPPIATPVAPVSTVGVGEFRATMTGKLDGPDRDLRSELCRTKDAELLAEFRKLEQETARYEQELQKISVQQREERVLTENRTYVVSKQHDFVVNSEWTNNGTSGRMRNGTSTKIPAPQPSRGDPRGQQPAPAAIPGPPPALPTAAAAAAVQDQEEQEYCTKKVKERVQELMASEAARAAAGPVVRRNGATATVSAPSTPTASRRKHIEAEFRQFRELRAQEQQQLKAGHVVGACQVPSKIPLPVVGSSPVGGKSAPSGLDDQQSGEDAVRVNVAALIATHQEKQASQAPPLGQLRNRVPLVAPPETACQPPGSAPPAVTDASDEVVVSVSDKCQQFERRIRQNSIGQQCPGDGWAGGPEPQAGPTPPPPQATPKRALKGTHERQMSGNACGADCSEADLLHEIDHALVLAKDFLFTRGVWSPFNRSTEVLTKEELAERSAAASSGKPPSEPLQPVWVPRSAPPSPASERREFRPIGFESPTPSRRTVGTPSPASVAAPWTQPGYTPPVEPTIQPTGVTTAPPQQVRFPPLPRGTSGGASEPTINSLLKSKDGKTASVTCTDTNTAAVTTSSSTVAKAFYQQQSGATTVRSASSPAIPLPAPDRMQSTTSHHQVVHQPKVDGIGPTTREGMPLTLRSEIDEGNRDKWYKQMYQTLHKAHDDDDYVTVRYKTRKGYPYKSPGGYQSEPEPNYDSDYTIKYSTLDRRRTPIGLSPTSYNKFNTLQPNPGGSQQASVQQPPVRARNVVPYRNQPGRIENYTPGRSSISDKESKEHQKQLTTSKTYEGNLSRALLKEQQGYESDSTLVFRKRVDQVDAGSALSPVEQKQHYRTMQAGGEIPLHGFRKPAPEKPKDRPDCELRVEIQEQVTTRPCTNPFLSAPPSAPIACYPITSIARPLDLFGAFPRETRTFVPPAPPSRKSSRSNSTLRIIARTTANYGAPRTLVRRADGQQQGVNYRSKSAGPAMAAASAKEEKNHENSTRVAKRSGGSRSPTTSGQQQQRRASPSPVAFGRGISKERTFAEEKKRIEEKLPKVVSVSTSILRNPDLRSPNEVKKALRSSYLVPPAQPRDLYATFGRGRSSPSSSSSVKRYCSQSVYSSTRSLHRGTGAAPKKETAASVVKATVTKPRAHIRRPSVTIKTSFERAAAVQKSKSSSNQSLARTSSTYSIDSTPSSKRRSRVSYIPASTCHTLPLTSARRGAAAATTSARLKPRHAGSLDRKITIVGPKRRSEDGVNERYSEHLVQRTADSIRTDSFFRNLFLKPGDSAAVVSGPVSSVLEKARLWNSLASRSEPSLRKSATSSGAREAAGEVIEQVNRFESLVRLSDEQDSQQFGYVRGRRMKIDYSSSYHERSRSEPPTTTTTTMTTTTTRSTVIQEELVGTGGAPRTIVGRRVDVAKRTSRSPSCRRIRTLRSEGHVRQIVRARSLSANERQSHPSAELVRSHSLNLGGGGGGGVSRARFRELNHFYSSLERLGQLEHVTSCSSGDLRARALGARPGEDIIDYDLWKRVREHERAERELWQLRSKLKQDQRERDFFFLPRDPADVRWNRDQDMGLRQRERSVEDLKGVLAQQARAFEGAKLRQLAVVKDHYKPLWRGSSVLDVATQLEERYCGAEDGVGGEKRDDSGGPHSLDSAASKQRYGVISSTLLSTLSSEQMRKLKCQLSEIYSGGGGGGEVEEEYVINVPERANRLETLLRVRSHSVLTKDQVQLPGPAREVGVPDRKTVGRAAEVEAMERRVTSLSRSLCQELKSKMAVNHHSLPVIGSKRKDRPSILPVEGGGGGGERFHSLERGLRKHAQRQKEATYADADESASSETSNRTVIFRTTASGGAVVDPPPPPSDPSATAEDIKSRIRYFEEKQSDVDAAPPVTVYRARDDSESPSEEDDATVGVAAADGGQRTSLAHSQSFTDLKDLFGEKRSVSCSYAPFTLRSRSSTPDYGAGLQPGEVKKIAGKFESGSCSPPPPAPRHYQSDSELTGTTSGGPVRAHESGDVSRMTHRYEVQARLPRCRKRKERIASPIPRHPALRRDDRFMPHINVISKTASLKREIGGGKRVGAGAATRRSASSGSEEFERLKSKFECGGGGGGGPLGGLSLVGKMYTSVPDMRELKDICGHLSGEWIAHQFPKPADNARRPPGAGRRGPTAPSSPTSPSPDPHHHSHRHHSVRSDRPQTDGGGAEPPKSKPKSGTEPGGPSASFLKQFYDHRRTKLEPESEPGGRTKSDRPVSDRQREAEALWRKIQSMANKSTVTFEEPHITFPSPPLKGAPPSTPPTPPPLPFLPSPSSIGLSSNGAESPRRYIESDVNIHYKTPIRFEYKDPIPDDELAYRQAEHMRRVYQEERRRKYINELEDMHSRRHTDNILPSQKSPIPLNRYDDFAADLSPKPQQPPLKTIARALYNFQGQSIRELSFRKGDIIYLRRQVDKNWYEGEHNATVGLLPANYIEILTRDSANVAISKPALTKRHPVREGKARAKFNFTAQTAVELSLLKGELVTLTRRVDDNWFEGKIGSKKGIFPVSYVEILTDIDGAESYDIEPVVSKPVVHHQPAAQSLTTHYGTTTHSNGRVSPGIVRETKTVQKTEVLHVDTSNEPISYRALYNYKPQNTDELELHEGDIVYVLEKCDDGWYVGTSARTGCFGTFPGNYVNKM
ncbi:uncharacterized protein LOC131215916 [Anopheles bellator]|uniref:uncharacterized protein LOC131215916 n=1 Tax=Anopheles bellator TaxID=139047 RepID=UPI002647328B|nr:uncharacterized protein LOC131215916 [Anopheles bellator]